MFDISLKESLVFLEQADWRSNLAELESGAAVAALKKASNIGRHEDFKQKLLFLVDKFELVRKTYFEINLEIHQLKQEIIKAPK